MASVEQRLKHDRSLGREPTARLPALFVFRRPHPSRRPDSRASHSRLSADLPVTSRGARWQSGNAFWCIHGGSGQLAGCWSRPPPPAVCGKGDPQMSWGVACSGFTPTAPAADVELSQTSNEERRRWGVTTRAGKSTAAGHLSSGPTVLSEGVSPIETHCAGCRGCAPASVARPPTAPPIVRCRVGLDSRSGHSSAQRGSLRSGRAAAAIPLGGTKDPAAAHGAQMWCTGLLGALACRHRG